MEITTYHKCKCAYCGQTIDYETKQAGEIIRCFKCGERSELPLVGRLQMVQFLGPPLPPFKLCPVCDHQMPFLGKVCPACKTRGKRKRLIVLASAGVIIIGVFAITGLHLKAKADRQTHEAAVIAAATPKPRILIEQPTNVYRTGKPDVKKDLFPEKFILQQRRGSDLIIAVGDIKNLSVNVYHDLRADVDLLDRNGTKIGGVSDYMSELGPREVWHFNALVTQTNAFMLRFARVIEQK